MSTEAVVVLLAGFIAWNAVFVLVIGMWAYWDGYREGSKRRRK